MPNPPRRKRFQIHLSTAMAMMFVALVLLWANLCRHDLEGFHESTFNNQEETFVSRRRIYGWPWTAYLHHEMTNIRLIPDYPGGLQVGGWQSRRATPSVRIALDVSMALGILFAVYILSEWLIRHRAPKQMSAEPESAPLKRFQFHLSTAVVLMFVVGGAMGLNLCYLRIGPGGPNGAFYFQGFPISFRRYPHQSLAWQNEGHEQLIATILNIAATIFICLLVALACEWLIRRRAERKGA